MRGLQKLNIAAPLVNLIHFMLTNRKVVSTLGSSTTGRTVNRGTPQGGVIYYIQQKWEYTKAEVTFKQAAMMHI